MANDCLVTKLKGSVNNNALPKIGEFVITVLSSGSNFIYPNGAAEFRSDGVAQYSIEHQGQYSRDMLTVSVAGKIFIKDDYTDITRIDMQIGTNTDLNFLKFRTNLERVFFRSEYNNTPVDVISIYNNNPNLTQLILTNPQPTSVDYKKNIPSSTHGLDLATSRFTHIACSMNCIWTSRASSENKLKLVQGINFGSYLTQFLIDMAACQGTSDRIYVYGTLSGTQEETDAINALKATTTEFMINEVNQKV